MDLGLTGKRALVTGASAGLGLSCAKALLGEGAAVTIASRSAERINAAADDLGGGATALTADVSDPDEATSLVAAAAEAMGGVDIVIANAGGPPPGNFETTDVDAYLEAFKLNALSTIALCKASIPAMRSRGWGRVVAVTSISVREPIAHRRTRTYGWTLLGNVFHAAVCPVVYSKETTFSPTVILHEQPMVLTMKRYPFMHGRPCNTSLCP